ncbi:uncharacterized protein LOC110425909 isoform X2 [Herrania umbratica]|uniref:Uncharacterized protein LOC110425909 isoform X2 n=1 Tax=Herrania umbratica TaxID=108875 RepID=A0A6J1BB19_9ROSI|nr:uncharacterized protein LOC110425909 isoform X2 [Herrania umbratica]
MSTLTNSANQPQVEHQKEQKDNPVSNYSLTKGQFQRLLVLLNEHSLGSTDDTPANPVNHAIVNSTFKGYNSQNQIRAHHHQKSHSVASSPQPSIFNSKVCGDTFMDND